MSWWSSTAKAKLNATNQEEWINPWKQHFKNLLGKPPKVMYETIMKIICKWLDIKVGWFTQEELDSVLRKIKTRKTAGLEEIPPDVWKTSEFDDVLLRRCNAIHNKNLTDRWRKGMHLPFPKEQWPRNSRELQSYNSYLHSGQDLQYSATQQQRTQNREDT